MGDTRLTKTRIRAGHWEGVLTGVEAAPKLEVLLSGETIADVSCVAVSGTAGALAIRVPIPAHALNEGAQTFLIRAAGSIETLAHFTVIAGAEIEEDIRAEVDLLRQELDMLKRAFRRHCLETAG